jgi:hypothetical protein
MSDGIAARDFRQESHTAGASIWHRHPRGGMLSSLNERTPKKRSPMRSRPRRRRRRPTLPALLAVALAAASAMAVAAPAGARTYFVSGHQIPGDATTPTMRGGLLGTWTLNDDTNLDTSLLQLAPLYHVIGTERFDGCLNRGRDWSCRHDPTGSLTSYNDTWLRYSGTNPEAVPLWSACVHPITSGTGAFAGAQGVIAMIDTYRPGGVYIDTRYDGSIILPDQGGAAAPPQALSGPSLHSAAAPLARAAAAPRWGCGTA